MSTPLVQVVIPAYQAEAYIGRTLESVQAQTFTDWACTVVDDGSTDRTRDVVAAASARDPRIHLVTQANGGPSRARNTALASLPDSVRYLAYLDADDLWLPHALEHLASGLQDHPDAVGAYGLAEYVDEHEQPLRPGVHPAIQRDRRRLRGRRLESAGPTDPMGFEELVVVGGLWPPATGLFRRDAVERVHGFDETMVHVEDWDLYIRMSRHGWFLPLDEQVAWYRQHPTQLTRGHVEMAVQYDRVRRQTWESPENTPAQRRIAARAWRQIHVRRTYQAVQRLRTAAQEHRWRDTATLVVGTSLLAVQCLGNRPPRASARTIALIHPELVTRARS